MFRTASRGMKFSYAALDDELVPLSSAPASARRPRIGRGTSLLVARVSYLRGCFRLTVEHRGLSRWHSQSMVLVIVGHGICTSARKRKTGWAEDVERIR